jgi:hypothetical protein
MKYPVNLTNDSYTIFISGKNWTERYYRDQGGWLKQSARGRKFRATADQVLNHLLPALAGIKSNLTVEVKHHPPVRSPSTPPPPAASVPRGTVSRRNPAS